MSHRYFRRKWIMATMAIVMIVGRASADSPGPITLKIVDGEYQYPEVVISIVSIQPDGSLTALDGRELNDIALEKLLRRPRIISGKELCLLRLQSSREKDVSMQTLGKALRRVRSLASLEVPTVIYVYLRELPPLETSEDLPKKK